MSTCQTESFSLTVPDSWADRSMITWVAPPSPKYKVMPNLLCSRGDLWPGAEWPEKSVFGQGQNALQPQRLMQA